MSDQNLAEWRKLAISLENEVNKVKTPLSYAEKVYQLLIHIDLVRKKLQKP